VVAADPAESWTRTIGLIDVLVYSTVKLVPAGVTVVFVAAPEACFRLKPMYTTPA
jgi:hypothetical protein